MFLRVTIFFLMVFFVCAIQKYLSNNREKTREDEWDNELYSLTFTDGSGAAGM